MKEYLVIVTDTHFINGKLIRNSYVMDSFETHDEAVNELKRLGYIFSYDYQHWRKDKGDKTFYFAAIHQMDYPQWIYNY